MTSWAADDAGVVRLSDGRLIRGTGARRPRGQTPAPEFDVYLLGRYPRMADWPYRWVRWPDFRLPASTEDAIDALREAHARAASERVEIACEGGVGRTGTALAVLAVMSGVPPDSCHRGVSVRADLQRGQDRLGGGRDRVGCDVLVAGDADGDLLDRSQCLDDLLDAQSGRGL